MTSQLSDRARRFMQTWPTCPSVQDLSLVRAALEEAGVPVTQPVLDFHQTFAGFRTDVWGDTGPLGIIHREVQKCSWFEPMKVGGYLKTDLGEDRSLACADIHISWEMMIGLDGTFYCNGPASTSYFHWTEQGAFFWEFTQNLRARTFIPEGCADELAETFLPRLTAHRIDALSDDYSQVYATDQFAVNVCYSGQQYFVWVAEGASPAELTGIHSVTDRRKKSLAELQSDLRSKFSERRYRALCDLSTTTDPAAGPLFLSVIDDENEYTRILALGGLQRTRFAKAIPDLHRLIRTDSNESVVLNAIYALAEIGGPEVLPALIDATRHATGFLRRDAAIALGKLGFRDALAALEDLRHDHACPKRYTGFCPTNEARPISHFAQEAIDAVRSKSRNRG